jgi:tellurite resistance protein
MATQQGVEHRKADVEVAESRLRKAMAVAKADEKNADNLESR